LKAKEVAHVSHLSITVMKHLRQATLRRKDAKGKRFISSEETAEYRRKGFIPQSGCSLFLGLFQGSMSR
jgi:hypothetical protein